MARDTTLQAHGLRKAYGSLVAVDELTFEAQAGEVVGLLGPNGAGKTTAIRVLTTIMPPTAGTFSVAGLPHTRAEIRADRRAAESAGYPDQQTGEEFVRYHARLFGTRGERAIGGDQPARRGRPRRAALGIHLHLQPRYAPASRHRPRARQRATGGVLRRTDARPRSSGQRQVLGLSRACR